MNALFVNYVLEVVPFPLTKRGHNDCLFTLVIILVSIFFIQLRNLPQPLFLIFGLTLYLVYGPLYIDMHRMYCIVWHFAR